MHLVTKDADVTVNSYQRDNLVSWRELSAPSTSLGTCCKVGTMYSTLADSESRVVSSHDGELFFEAGFTLGPLRLAVAVALPLQSPTSASCGLRPIETQT